MVVYQLWNRKYLYPYGHVIGVLPPDLSPLDEAAIRRILCGLPQPHQAASKSSTEARRLCSKALPKNLANRRHFSAMRSFTIDNEKMEGLDNAISYSVN